MAPQNKGSHHCTHDLSGAENRTRTGTGLRPADFKSAASAIPPPRQLHVEFSMHTEEKSTRLSSTNCGRPLTVGPHLELKLS